MSLQKEAWDPRHVACPVCRVHLPPPLLQHMLTPGELGIGHPEPEQRNSLQNLRGPDVVTLPDDQDAVVDDALLQTIRRMQEQRMRVAEAQVRCGGLVQKR